MVSLATMLPGILEPDLGRTVIRPFQVEDPAAFADLARSRAQRIVDRILALDEADLQTEIGAISLSLDERHRDVEAVLRRRFEDLEGLTVDRGKVTPDQALLIGAYFSEEFSFESAALFNPSAVRHPDQSGVADGETRFVLSLRGIGEGHVSSLTFRTGVWEASGAVRIDTPSKVAVGPVVERVQGADGEITVHLKCGGARDLSETVIFPFMPSQGRGIEDVRLVEFTHDDGKREVFGTYTAFNGTDVRQAILRTEDFVSFTARGIKGPLHESKGMALFPRRVAGKLMALARYDNENIQLVSSDDLYSWELGEKILGPKWPWEFVQMGNCGSPIEIDAGWLVLTHGVGMVRNYCIGACLLDKDDPSKVLGRLRQPLIAPEDKSRDGYVPNVVYSCGGFVRDRTLLLPYGEADNFSAFATVEIDALLSAMV